MALMSIQKFRNDHKLDMKTNVDYLVTNLDQIDTMYKTIREKVTDLSLSDNAPYKVAQKIVEEELLQMDSLLLTHKAMYKINDALNTISMKFLPDLTEIYSDSKSIMGSIKLELMNDPMFTKLTTSNAERNRESDFILMDMIKTFGKIEVKYKLSKDMISHLNSMGSYCNRLDSMIRLKQNIIGTTEFESMVAQGQNIIKDASI